MAIFAIGLQHKALSRLAGVFTPCVASGQQETWPSHDFLCVRGALMPAHPHSEALYRDHEAAGAAGQIHSAITEIAAAAIAQPSRKPKRKCSDLFDRPPSALISG